MRTTPFCAADSFTAEGGEIKQIGKRPPARLRADRTISARYCCCVPGLINTHHHLCQTLTRACTAAADMELFDWLRTLYPLWARLDEESMHVAALVGMAELLLSGCTTTTDHHYLFPRGQTKLIDAEISAARKIGMRFHPTRGSMSVGESKGGLPPDSVVQSEDEILEDCERLIHKYHDPAPRLDAADCACPLLPVLRVGRADASNRGDGPSPPGPYAHPSC